MQHVHPMGQVLLMKCDAINWSGESWHLMAQFVIDCICTLATNGVLLFKSSQCWGFSEMCSWLIGKTRSWNNHEKIEIMLIIFGLLLMLFLLLFSRWMIYTLIEFFVTQYYPIVLLYLEWTLTNRKETSIKCMLNLW